MYYFIIFLTFTIVIDEMIQNFYICIVQSLKSRCLKFRSLQNSNVSISFFFFFKYKNCSEAQKHWKTSKQKDMFIRLISKRNKFKTACQICATEVKETRETYFQYIQYCINIYNRTSPPSQRLKGLCGRKKHFYS